MPLLPILLAPLLAQVTPLDSFPPGWALARASYGCVLIRRYPDALLLVADVPAHGVVDVTIASDKMVWVEPDVSVPLTLALVTDHKIDLIWDNLDCRGAVGAGHNGCLMRLKGEALVDGMARSESLALVKDEKLIVAMPLDGAAPAMKALRGLSGRRHGLGGRFQRECRWQVPPVFSAGAYAAPIRCSLASSVCSSNGLVTYSSAPAPMP